MALQTRLGASLFISAIRCTEAICNDFWHAIHGSCTQMAVKLSNVSLRCDTSLPDPSFAWLKMISIIRGIQDYKV